MRVNTVDAMQGKEELILNHFALPDVTGNRHTSQPCPICSKRKKFRLHWHQNKLNYICVCGNGSLLNLVMETQGLDFKHACKEIDKIIGNEFKPQSRVNQLRKEINRPHKKDQLMNRYEAIHTLIGSPVENYLKSRGIHELPRLGVKFSNAEFDHTENRSFNCMYAIATTDNYEIAYSHKTYLENGLKADIAVNKKMETVNKYNEQCQNCGTEHAANVAVRMFECDSILGISEGIESALSAKQLFDVPTWSVLNTSIMKAFKAPLGVKTLVIYADNDKNGAGLAAAFVCGNKNILSNNDVEKVIIRAPEEKDADFNDMLLRPMGTIDFILNN